jgi:hypothetical protein
MAGPGGMGGTAQTTPHVNYSSEKNSLKCYGQRDPRRTSTRPTSAYRRLCMAGHDSSGLIKTIPMEPGEALGLTAQIAVALAGFAGVVVAFRRSSLHEWSPIDKYRLWLLLADSAVPLLCCLFAILLLTVKPAPISIWRWCSAFSTLLLLPLIYMSRRTTAKLGPNAIRNIVFRGSITKSREKIYVSKLTCHSVEEASRRDSLLSVRLGHHHEARWTFCEGPSRPERSV